MAAVTALDLSLSGPDLTVALCDVESVSGNERALADLLEQSLRDVPHLTVDRDGDAVVARTSLSRAERVVLAGSRRTTPSRSRSTAWSTARGSTRSASAGEWPATSSRTSAG